MPGILCEHCTALCCNYIALPLDTPETRDDLDDIRWFLMHERVSVFVEDGDWYIAFHTRCRHLLADQRCAVYDTRPKVCRTYSTDDCDYHSGDYHWQQHFTAPEHLDEYVRAHPSRRDKRGRANGAGRRRRTVSALLGNGHDRRGVALPQLRESE
jgi:Fe-S-cluster containining protein